MPAVNKAYIAMFRRARDLLAPDESLGRIDRNARTHLLLSQLFWAPAWLDDWEPDDFDRVTDRVTPIVVSGLLTNGASLPRAARIPLAAVSAADAASPSEPFLKAATQLINDEGYHGASVDRISANLNVSKGAFYYHHERKDDLVLACFQRTFDIMWCAIHEAESMKGSGLETLVTLASALVERQMSGDAPLLRTSALTTVPENLQGGLIEKLHRLTVRFSSIICDGVADGSVRPVDSLIAAEMITAAVNAAAELQLWAPGITAETVSRHYLAPLFTGLAARD